MRKIFFSFFFFALIFVPSVSAQTVTLPMPTASPTPSIGPTIVNYELPYPGILPGSPLYPIKVLRDKVSEVLTTNSLRKSNYFLLQADKRLAASLLLFKQGDGALAESTLSKGQNYLDKSIDKMIEAKKSQESVIDVYAKIKSSSAKQRQEIKTLSNSAKEDEKQKLISDYKRAQEIENRVNAFRP